MQNNKKSSSTPSMATSTSTSTQSPQQQGTSRQAKEEGKGAQEALNCPNGKCAQILRDAKKFFKQNHRLEAEKQQWANEKQQLQAEMQQLGEEKRQLEEAKQQLEEKNHQLEAEKQQLQGEKQQLEAEKQQLGELAMELSQIHAAQSKEAAQRMEALKRRLEAEHKEPSEVHTAQAEEAAQQLKALEEEVQVERAMRESLVMAHEAELQGLKTEVEQLHVQLDVAHGMYARLQNRYEPTNVPAGHEDEQIVFLGTVEKSATSVGSSTSAQSSVKRKAKNVEVGNIGGARQSFSDDVMAISSREIKAKFAPPLVKSRPAQLEIPLVALVNDGGKLKQVLPQTSIDSAIEENFAGCKITTEEPPAVKKARQDSGEGTIDSGIVTPADSIASSSSTF